MNFVKIIAGPAFAISLAMSPALAQRQEGLVNVSVEDNVVQVPIQVAANVCGIDVAVLAELGPDDVACTIDQETATEANIGRGKKAD